MSHLKPIFTDEPDFITEAELVKASQEQGFTVHTEEDINRYLHDLSPLIKKAALS